MTNELTTFQAQQVKWLKQQVRNLEHEKNGRDPRPRIDQELFAAREELDDYINKLREHGYQV